MTEGTLDHPEPWTEAEYFALDETTNRIELIDGGLWVSPGPNIPHQGISSRLFLGMNAAVEAAGMCMFATLNVRLAPGRVLIPDFVVGTYAEEGRFVEPSEVTLVVEITSPSNAATDRVLKMHLYAAAKIEWYLLVEPNLTNYKSIMVRLFRLHGDHYLEHAVAKDGETLFSDEPFPIAIPTAFLRPRSKTGRSQSGGR
jgi:Uma2 family endonuclease